MDIDTININVDVSTPTDPVGVTPTPAGPQGPPGPQGIPGERGEPGQPGRDGAIQYTAGDNITIENNVISATIPNTIATKQYVDDAIASAITNVIGGSY